MLRMISVAEFIAEKEGDLAAKRLNVLIVDRERIQERSGNEE